VIPAEPVDTTADEIPAEPGTELVVAPAQAVGAFIAGESPEQIIATAATVANALKALIDQQDMAKSMGGDRKHVEVGAWQACGMMLGALGGQPLHAETVWTRVARDPATGEALRRTYQAEVKRYFKRTEGGGIRQVATYDVDGYDWEACVEIRTPDGTVVGRAEAMCSRAEETWSQRDDYAVRSMAETRAESRAFRRAIGWIVHMAGYSPTPAEEMGHQPGQPMTAPDLPAWATKLMGPDNVSQLRAGLAYMLDDEPDGQRVNDVLARLAQDVGDPDQVPWIAGRSVLHAASILKAVNNPAPAAEPAPGPADAEPVADATVVDDESNPRLNVL